MLNFKLSIAIFSSTMRACVQDQFSHIVCPARSAGHLLLLFHHRSAKFPACLLFCKVYFLTIVMFSIKNYKKN